MPPPRALLAPLRAPCALSRARPGARLHGCVSRLDRAQGHTAALCPPPGRITTHDTPYISEAGDFCSGRKERGSETRT